METARNIIAFDFGTFEAFNFRGQCAIDRILSAQEVLDWDHDRDGEAEFWPSGDSAGVALVFKGKSAITRSELIDLDRLLQELEGDHVDNFIRIHYALSVCGEDLPRLSVTGVEDHNLHIFFGTSFMDLRREAAYELFELYYPEAYEVWERTLCDGLIFDPDIFLDSPSFFTDEFVLGDNNVLLVAPQ